MPLENATNIPELVITNPASGDGAGSTDNQIRMMKGAIKGSFSGFDGAQNVTLSETKINALPGAISSIADALGNYCLPHLEKKGSIKPWPTGYAAIPAGWQLADGTNGTPDLRGLAVIGANGSTYIDGQNYGSATATTSSNGAHSHGGSTAGHALSTSQMPSHSHSLTLTKSVTADDATGGANREILTANRNIVSDNLKPTTSISSAGSGEQHSHGISEDGAHTHTASTIQPSRALSWIIKTTEPSASAIATAIADAMTAAGLA